MTARTIVFAPGAGAPSTSAWMTAWAARLGALGRVAPFDYPYMLAGRKLPDRLPALIEAHRAAIATAVGPKARGKLVLAGKSMGSRVGCHVAVDGVADLGRRPSALVCFGYPLVSAGKRRDVRAEILERTRTPILFVQGDRDPLCPLELLAEVRARMTCASVVHVVEGGDHSLLVQKRFADQRDVDARILAAITDFLARHA